MDIENLSRQLAPVSGPEVMTNQVVSKENKLVKPDQLIDSTGEHYQAGTLSPYTLQQLADGIEETNKLLIGKNTKLAYQIHEGTGRTVVQLLDMQTNEVVKEIPPIKFLDSLAKIWETAGIIVNQKG